VQRISVVRQLPGLLEKSINPEDNATNERKIEKYERVSSGRIVNQQLDFNAKLTKLIPEVQVNWEQCEDIEDL